MTPDQIDETLNKWELLVNAFFEGQNFLPTALAFIWDAQDRCLILVLTKNAMARAKSGGKKAFKPAGGGHHPVEDDNCIVKTAVREAKEELGISPGALQFVGPLCGPVTLLARQTDKDKLKRKGFKIGKVYFGLLFTTKGSYRILRQESEIASVRRVYSQKEWAHAIRGNRPKMRMFLGRCLKLTEEMGVVQFDTKPKSKKIRTRKVSKSPA